MEIGISTGREMEVGSMSSSRFARILAVAVVMATGVFVAGVKAALETVTSIRNLGEVTSQLNGSAVIQDEVPNSAPGTYNHSISATSGNVTIRSSIDSFIPDTRGDSVHLYYKVQASGTLAEGQAWKGSASLHFVLDIDVVDHPLTVAYTMNRRGFPGEMDTVYNEEMVLEPGESIQEDIKINVEFDKEFPGDSTIYELAEFGLRITPLIYVDIRPQTCPNELNLRSTDLLEVAVLGNWNFEATGILRDSIALSRAGIPAAVSPLSTNIEDVATPFEGDDCVCHTLKNDGYLDLTMEFDTKELVRVLKLRKLGDGETIPLILTFKNWDGAEYKGADCVLIQKKLKPEKKKKK